jgi:hypothetical protein
MLFVALFLLFQLHLSTHVVSASSTYRPNCTIPRELVNFVYSPAVRGTLDILWSSLFTLLICTWTVQHLNIPLQRDTPPKSRLERLQHRIEPILAKLRWMTITLLLPEFIVARAATEWYSAKQVCKRMQDMCSEGQEWTTTHAFFANMGGFVIKEPLRK